MRIVQLDGESFYYDCILLSSQFSICYVHSAASTSPASYYMSMELKTRFNGSGKYELGITMSLVMSAMPHSTLNLYGLHKRIQSGRGIY